MPKQETLVLIYLVVGTILWTGIVGSALYNIDRGMKKPRCHAYFGCPCGECPPHRRKF